MYIPIPDKDLDWEHESRAYYNADKLRSEIATLRAENERLREALDYLLCDDPVNDFGEWFESVCKKAKEALK